MIDKSAPGRSLRVLQRVLFPVVPLYVETNLERGAADSPQR